MHAGEDCEDFVWPTLAIYMKFRLLIKGIIAIFPSFLKRFCYRHLFGYKVGKRVRIGLSIIDAGECSIDDDVSFDLGILLQAPWKLIPTLGFVIHDVGDTNFNRLDGLRLKASKRPETVKQSIDAAAALFPIYGNQLRSVWTIEYSDMTNSRNDTDSAKRIHAGIEFNARDIFFFRMGYNQRYWTAGFEIASERLQWQVSSYGEEIGTESSPREDRRLNTKLSLRF